MFLEMPWVQWSMMVQCNISWQLFFFLKYIFAFNNGNFTKAQIKARTVDLNTEESPRTTESFTEWQRTSIVRQGATRRGQWLFHYQYREINTSRWRGRVKWWKQYGTRNLHPSHHRHRRRKRTCYIFFRKEQSGHDHGRSMQKKKKHVKIQLVDLFKL